MTLENYIKQLVKRTFYRNGLPLNEEKKKGRKKNINEKIEDDSNEIMPVLCTGRLMHANFSFGLLIVVPCSSLIMLVLIRHKFAEEHLLISRIL